MTSKKDSSIRVKEPKSANKRGNQLTSEKKQELLHKIKKRYEQGCVNKLALARELNINRGTLLNLIKELDVEMQDLPTIKVELKLIYERLIERALYLLDKLQEFEEQTSMPDIKEELKVMNEIQSIINNFYKLLQELGDAPKVADTLNVNQEVNHTLNLNYNAQRNFVSNLDKQLEGITDEKKRQEIVINLLDSQENETQSQ